MKRLAALLLVILMLAAMPIANAASGSKEKFHQIMSVDELMEAANRDAHFVIGRKVGGKYYTLTYKAVTYTSSYGKKEGLQARKVASMDSFDVSGDNVLSIGKINRLDDDYGVGVSATVVFNNGKFLAFSDRNNTSTDDYFDYYTFDLFAADSEFINDNVLLRSGYRESETSGPGGYWCISYSISPNVDVGLDSSSGSFVAGVGDWHTYNYEIWACEGRHAIPKTGDSNHPLLWMGMILLGGIGLIATCRRWN